MTVAYLAAFSFELRPFVRRWPVRRPVSLPLAYACVGQWQGHDSVAVAGGMGFRAAARAARIVMERFRPDLILSIGSCGGLDPELSRGEVVTGAGVVCPATGQRFPAAWQSGQAVEIVSQDRIATCAAEKFALRRWGQVVEMEAYAVAQVASEKGVGMGCIKVVLDTATEGLRLDLNQARDETGGISITRLLRLLPASPFEGVWELAAWRRRSQESARSLGSYLASCQI